MSRNIADVYRDVYEDSEMDRSAIIERIGIDKWGERLAEVNESFIRKYVTTVFFDNGGREVKELFNDDLLEKHIALMREVTLRSMSCAVEIGRQQATEPDSALEASIMGFIHLMKWHGDPELGEAVDDVNRKIMAIMTDLIPPLAGVVEISKLGMSRVEESLSTPAVASKFWDLLYLSARYTVTGGLIAGYLYGEKLRIDETLAAIADKEEK